jgi:hypothetical protein
VMGRRFETTMSFCLLSAEPFMVKCIGVAVVERNGMRGRGGDGREFGRAGCFAKRKRKAEKEEIG